LYIPFWTVSKSQDELKHEKCQIADLQHIIDNRGNFIAEGPSFVLVRRTRGPHNVENKGTG
jgi:hypothetical protein